MPQDPTMTADNVDVAQTGGVAFAPTDTPAPTDAETPVTTPWRFVGYISQDGVVEARDRSTNNIVAWQNSDVVRVVTTEASITVEFTMIETNLNSLALFYGAEVEAADSSIEIVPRASGGRRAIVVDYQDGDDKHVRLYLPNAEVTAVTGPTLSAGDAVGMGVTITGYPQSFGEGETATSYSAKKWFSDLATS